MLEYFKIKNVFIILICFLSGLIVLSNFVNLGKVSDKKIILGTDVRGGNELFFELNIEEYVDEKIQDIASNLRRQFKNKKIKSFPRIEEKDGEKYITIKTKNEEDKERVRKLLEKEKLEINDSEKTIKAHFSKKQLKRNERELIQESVKVLRKRINNFGLRNFSVESAGRNKIMVQLPKIGSLEDLKSVLERTAKMNFHLVDMDAQSKGVLSPGVVRMVEMNGDFEYYVRKEISLQGELLTNAQGTVYQNKPAIIFQLNPKGTKKFANITKNHTGKLFAVVLDGKVITAPMINSPITNGTGVIFGKFTQDEAEEIASLLRTGSLPVSINLIKEKQVDPTISRNTFRNLIIFGAVVHLILFGAIFFIYKKSGILMNFVLLMNVFVTLAAISFFNAVLTLIGLIVVILNTFVVSGFLIRILKRVQKEWNNGRPIFNAINKGFDVNKKLILKVNFAIATLSVLMYIFGTVLLKNSSLVLFLCSLASCFSIFLLFRAVAETWSDKLKIE